MLSLTKLELRLIVVSVVLLAQSEFVEFGMSSLLQETI